MVTIGRNLISENVQRHLSRSSTDLASVSERLSSGQRINNASDDAAGLAISMSLQTDARVFSQAIRNLNDGISAANIAESAIGQLTGILERVQELAAQSANSTYHSTQREAMQLEVSALQQEWNRIVEGTTFNGKYLLTGSDTRTVLQGGAGTENTLALQFGKEALAGGFDNFAGGTTRVSTSSSGAQSNYSSYHGAISADGRYVAFDSAASNIVSADTNISMDVFVKNTLTGTTTRISTDSAGIEGDDYSYLGDMSADGRYVAFYSYSTNLAAGDTNGRADAFLKDTLTGTTTRISTDSSGNQATGGHSSNLAISADGRYVAFQSYATNLVNGDTNGDWDVFVKDTLTGETTIISTDSSGNQGNAASLVKDISADGRYVLFQSDATNLVTGDTNAGVDVFVKDTVTGVTTRVNTDSNGVQTNHTSTTANAISADGRYVVFTSYATNLVSGDTNGTYDVFLKDTQTGTTTRVSTDSSGQQSNAQSTDGVISADGRYISFTSTASNLVSGDTNGVIDTFIVDTHTGTRIRLSTDSGGNQGNGNSKMAAISADGRYAVFESQATNLVSGDTNGYRDVFLRDLTRAGLQQLSGLVVSNQASAKVSLDLIEKYRAEIADYRSKIGANTSRIQSFSNVLSVAEINYKQADSRIIDADIADESSKLVAATIKQQIGAQLAGLANLAPQIAIDLLRNT